MATLALRVTARRNVVRALAAARRRVAGAVTAAVSWLRARTREQWLGVFLALVVLAYLAVLFTTATSTGRGGR